MAVKVTGKPEPQFLSWRVQTWRQASPWLGQGDIPRSSSPGLENRDGPPPEARQRRQTRCLHISFSRLGGQIFPLTGPIPAVTLRLLVQGSKDSG